MKRLVLAECRKIFFLKFSRRYLAVLIIAGLAFGALLSLTTQMTTGRRFDELGSLDVLSMNLLGVDLANILLMVFAAMSVHREFSTGSIQVSLSLSPGRTRLFAAKLLTYLGLSAVVSILTVALACLASQSLLTLHGMPPLFPLDAAAMRMLAGVAAMPIFYCLLTVAAAFLLWSGAGAITFSLGALAAQAVVGILPEGVQSLLLPITPQAAIHNLAGMSPAGSMEAVSLALSATVLAAWVGIASVTASWRFRWKDV